MIGKVFTRVFSHVSVTTYTYYPVKVFEGRHHLAVESRAVCRCLSSLPMSPISIDNVQSSGGYGELTDLVSVKPSYLRVEMAIVL